MNSLTIPDLDDAVQEGLRERAAARGHSMEAEAREILTRTVVPRHATGTEFLAAIRACMAESGGFEEGELVLPDRPPPREPPTFE